MPQAEHEKIEHAAAAWLARQDRGELSAEDERAFTEWLHASVSHRVSYLRLQQTWARTHRLAAIAHRPALIDIERAARFHGMPRSMRTWRVAAAAAVLVVIALVTSFYPRSSAEYATVIGDIQMVPLEDGSHITINTASAVDVSYSRKRREVRLGQGEAFFDVARDEARPFLVHAGDVHVEVVGTQFGVYRREHEVQILVTEGRVRVHWQGGAEANQDLVLRAHDLAHITSSGVRVERLSEQTAGDTLAWRNGLIVFRNTPLIEAVKEFNRYSVTPIVIADPTLAQMPIGGSFKINNAAGFVRLLEQAFGARATNEADAIVMTMR